jgi:hypothetical protein
MTKVDDLVKLQLKLLQSLKALEGRVRKLEGSGNPDVRIEQLIQKQEEILSSLKGLAIRVDKLEGKKVGDKKPKKPQEQKIEEKFESKETDEELPPVVYEYLGTQPKLAPQNQKDLMRNDSDVTIRLRNECFRLGFKTWRFKRVPSDYYQWEYEARRAVLGAPSIDYLCKSVIMENTKLSTEDYSDRTNSKYYLIVVVSFNCWFWCFAHLVWTAICRQIA